MCFSVPRPLQAMSALSLSVRPSLGMYHCFPTVCKLTDECRIVTQPVRCTSSLKRERAEHSLGVGSYSRCPEYLYHLLFRMDIYVHGCVWPKTFCSVFVVSVHRSKLTTLYSTCSRSAGCGIYHLFGAYYAVTEPAVLVGIPRQGRHEGYQGCKVLYVAVPFSQC